MSRYAKKGNTNNEVLKLIIDSGISVSMERLYRTKIKVCTLKGDAVDVDADKIQINWGVYGVQR